MAKKKSGDTPNQLTNLIADQAVHIAVWTAKILTVAEQLKIKTKVVDSFVPGKLERTVLSIVPTVATKVRNKMSRGETAFTPVEVCGMAMAVAEELPVASPPEQPGLLMTPKTFTDPLQTWTFRAGDAKPGEDKPGEVKPGDITPGELKPGDLKPGELKGEAKPGDEAKGLVGDAKTDDIFKETVVTASRGAQTPLDSPNSTTIITKQDIQLSGITRIPELLRRVAGTDVMQITGGDTNVSIRGFNSRLANKVLVLVNGRSVYNDILGSTYWETLSIDVDQIERIEVVRGPGSALYGANAFAGVVNIITIAPGEGKSGLRGGLGDHLQGYGSAWVTGKQGSVAYRASAGYTRYPRWTREVESDRKDLVFLPGVDPNVGAQNIRLDLRTVTTIDPTKRFLLGGGFARSNIDTYGIGPFNDISLTTDNADAAASFESDLLNVRSYYVRLEVNGGADYSYSGHTLYPTHALQNTLNGEVEITRKFNAPSALSHDIHVGLGYRLKNTHIETSAVRAGKLRARQLRMDEGDPVLRICFTPHDMSDTPLSYSEMFFRGDAFSYKAVVKR